MRVCVRASLWARVCGCEYMFVGVLARTCLSCLCGCVCGRLRVCARVYVFVYLLLHFIV